MKALSTALLVLAAAGACALDVRPQPGLALSSEVFTDIRAFAGNASSVSSASASGAKVDGDLHLGPRAGAQFIRGKAGDAYGLALGIEYVYDDHLGTIASFSGTNLAYGGEGGLATLRSHSLNLLPRVVLRPDFDDPIDWGPGSIQVELGPMFGVGVGRAHIGSSGHSDWAPVWNWGFRVAAVGTVEGGWQVGFEAGWDSFSSDPSWGGRSGSVSGDGFMAALLLGRRL